MNSTESGETKKRRQIRVNRKPQPRRRVAETQPRTETHQVSREDSSCQAVGVGKVVEVSLSSSVPIEVPIPKSERRNPWVRGSR